MKNIPLYMSATLRDIPEAILPSGFHFRLFREGDEQYWAEINTATKEFTNMKSALNRFESEFMPYRIETKKRVIILETDEGKPVGTAAAWFGDFNGKQTGRLHWVEIMPEYQGRKLGKPLVIKALEILSSFHNEAYLKTQTTSLTAIHIYLKLGFKPVIRNTEDQEGWNLVFSHFQCKKERSVDCPF
jgi:ribosomal protein S18 acetylase RimI-like enzyme